MVEVADYVKNSDTESEVTGFIKKFNKLKLKEAEEFKKKLLDLDLLKLNEEHAIKVIDIMPEDSEELNKIFSDINLDEDETKKILEVIKEFK